MCNTITPGCLPAPSGRKYSQCTVLLFSSGVTTGEGNVTLEIENALDDVSTGRCWNAKRLASRRNNSGKFASPSAGWKATSPVRTFSSARSAVAQVAKSVQASQPF